MQVSVPFGGGCACGAIRYQCTALPLFVFQCHCRDCQRATGGPFAVNVWFSLPDISFSKEPANFAVTADSGYTVHHYYCRDCGSPIGMERVGGPARGVRAASLDDPSWLEPIAKVWTCKSYPWDQRGSQLKDYETQPRDEEWPAVFEEQARRFRESS